ncbi:MULTISPECIES: GlxA family transcriptional regulator [unclassified Pseudomonas]|uniref:GlxA family transcriptional regulator n=1 Tax=unclassified Pseudomonas TaxID=196821 RepID=UPI002010964B|nr:MULTISPECIES: GlxA family transcriptional regulator [unclassified Pseudomonas]
MIEYLRHLHETANEAGEPSLVARLDQQPAPAPRKRRGTAELSVGIVLWPRFPLLSLSGLTDALRHAADTGDQSRPIRCEWKVLGTPGQRVASSGGLDVPIDSEMGDPQRFDYIVVIGGLLDSLADVPKSYPAFLHQAAAAGVPLIGLCTGSFVLARHGLMEGHTACVHAYHADDWKRLFPTLRFITHNDFLIDKDRITCAGGVSVIELAVHLIGMHCGPDRAGKVVHQMTVAKSGTGSFLERRKALGYASSSNRRLHEAVMLMEKHMAEPLEIEAIAHWVGTSKRQLERLFMAETDTSPAQFYRQVRLRFGRWLLVSSDRQIGEIAFECGFADAPHFIRHFQSLFGLSPGKLRKELLKHAGP